MLRTGGVGLLVVLAIYFVASGDFFPIVVQGDTPGTATTTPPAHILDKAAYDTKKLLIANAPTSTWNAYMSATSSNPGISLPAISASI